MATKTFKEAYGKLQGHAETLREQQEPNIDDLLNIVTESVEAYKVCKQRIDAVEKALEKALSDTSTPPREAARSTRPMPAPLPDMADDGDIPF
jgi:exodeoxyribonuclease VII small subunit